MNRVRRMGQRLMEQEKKMYEEDSPKLEEILEVIKQLNNKRNPKVHRIGAQIMKFRGPEVAKALQVLIITIWKKKKYKTNSQKR